MGRSSPVGEDVGKEMGENAELDGDRTRVHEVHSEEVPPPRYEEGTGVEIGDSVRAEMTTKPEALVLKEGEKQ